MSIRASETGTLHEIDRWEGGAGWLAYPDEFMERASHALRIEGEVWLVDPVDVPGLDEWLADLGEVAGVLVLLDRHRRDAAEVATRHGVSVHIPAWMTGVAGKLDAPVERLGDTLGGYEVRKVVDSFGWQEAALYDPSTGTLVVPEALGTNDYYRTRAERVGVHPMLRLLGPPKSLLGLDVERLLVGHGAGLDSDVTAAIEDAVRGARKRTPELYVQAAKRLITR